MPLKIFLFGVIIFERLFSCSIAGEDPALSHALFTNALKRHVHDGLVNYAAIAHDADFDRYVNWLADARPDEYKTRDAKMAFWVNAYNAFAIKGVIENSRKESAGSRPLNSVLDVRGFFDAQKYRVAGLELTLNQIEKEIIFPKFEDPRLHFVLVCAAISCPKLQPEAFTAGNILAQIHTIGKNFINDKSKNRLDRNKAVFQLSQIFNWYRDDFEKGDSDLVDFVKQYLPEKERRFVEQNKMTLEFMEYDWSLNIQK